MKKVKSLLNKMSSLMRPPAGLGDLRLIKSFVSKVFSLFITTQSAEDSRQRPSGMTALFDVKAFTLVELLVVVLIIGVLSAIAIPMYQGAVDKSHWSTMLPASKAIKDAEEAFKMTNGEYSGTMEHLDVQISNNDLTFTLNTPNNLSQPNVVRVTNSKLDNVRLASYLDDSPLFAGQLHCEAKNEGSTPNERGQRLCEKLLGGQYLKTTDDGYTRYLLDQSVDLAICGEATGSWSTSKTKCYEDTTTRCADLNMPVIAGKDQCGYTNTSGQEILDEGFCQGTTMFGCSGSKIRQGGTCLGMYNPACYKSEVFSGGVCQSEVERACQEAKVYNGGKCIGNAGAGCHAAQVYNGGECVGKKSNACSLAHIYSGGKCIAETENACPESVIYDGTGCCEDYGKGYCLDAPKC